MKKRTKIIFTVLIALLLILSGALLFVGNYLYDLAINPNTDKSMIFQNDATKNDTTYQKDQDTILDKKNDLYITSKDHLKLHAYEIKQDSNQWVIAVHGYHGKASEMSHVARAFYDRGYNVLLPDLRGHGQSEGDYIGMGWDDRLDILHWINEIIKKDSNAKIILYGVSMGAATVMNTVGEELPTNVKLAIEDCGYTSTWDIFAYQLDALFHLPDHPFLDAANLVTYLRAGYSFKNGPIDQIAKCNIPMLFIHGSEDHFVPTPMMDELYEKATCPKEKLIIKGAEHAQSKDIDPITYWNTIDAYLAKYL